MLTSEQILEIREHLETAQNPIFFFDNDPDGLCSFLILQRFIERGKGIPIKSFPKLIDDYFRKVVEFNADYIFILDKAEVSDKFWEKVKEVNIPVVWIDHHAFKFEDIPDFVNYYNSFDAKNNDSAGEPVTSLCYKATQKKDDVWLGVAGCIADKFVPEFYNDFMKKYSDLGIKSNDAFEIFYKSEIGKIAKFFTFGLKDRTTNVINMLKFLMSVHSPYEVLSEGSKNSAMHKRFREIDEKYQRLIERAKEIGNYDGKLLYFQYGGDLSISSDLSNEISFLFPDKIIVIAYVSGYKANISGRGKNIRKIILEIIGGLEGATGGGHQDAVGAQVQIEDLEFFKKELKEKVGD